MKKFFSFAVVAIAMAVLASCGNKKTEAEKTPVGTPIGQGLTMVEKTDGTISLLDKSNYELGAYKKIEDCKSYLKCTEPEGRTVLLRETGSMFCRCDSFVVKPYYTIKPEEKTQKKFILSCLQDWVVGFDYTDKSRLCEVEGKKLEMYPLTNGQIIFKLETGYGIAKFAEADPIMSAECSEIVVVNEKEKVCYLIKTSDWAGYIDENGDEIKPLTSAQFKAAKKAGKEIWSEGKISARSVSKI